MAQTGYQADQQENGYLDPTQQPVDPNDPQAKNTVPQPNGGYTTGTQPTKAAFPSTTPPPPATTPPAATPPASSKYTAQMPTNPDKYAGFDPGAHQGQTFDTANPSEGMKYAVQNTLNDMDPNDPDWADKAAAVLKQQFGPSVPISVLRGPDGSARLTYGDESVSSGGASGGGAKGKFTWTAAQQGDTNFGGGSGGGGGTGGGGGIGSTGGGFDGTDDATHQAILRLLARGEAPTTADSVAAQYQPAAAAIDRSAQLERAAAAQRGAVSGTNIGGGGGALDGEIASIRENAGSQQGQLMAKLMGDEIAAKRQDVATALQNASGEDARRLQLMLAQLDDATRRLQIGNQNQQFYDNLGNDIGWREYLANQSGVDNLGT